MVGKNRLRSAAWCLAVLGRTFHNPVAGKFLSIASFRRPLDLDQALRTCTELHWVQENRPILFSQKHPKQNWIVGGWKEIKALKTTDVSDERVSELRNCVKVNVAVLGYLSPIVCTVSVHVQQHWTQIHRAQELFESRSGRPGLPALPNSPSGVCGHTATLNKRVMRPEVHWSSLTCLCLCVAQGWSWGRCICLTDTAWPARGWLTSPALSFTPWTSPTTSMWATRAWSMSARSPGVKRGRKISLVSWCCSGC